MGYTHYWYRPQELPKDAYAKVAEDAKKVRAWLDGMSVPLKGGLGTGEPIINDTEIVFNGDAKCGHTHRDLGITWPAPDACGVGRSDGARAGNWFAGALLARRTCDGDCSHETFYLPRVFKPETYEKPKADGTYFAFCKTAYKPYDLAVTACLLIAKHHLGDLIVVHSDGEPKDWQDARNICEGVLGYGSAVVLDFEEERAQA